MKNEFYYFKGRTALYALLKSFDISEGDIIIMPAFTCVVVPYTVTYFNAIPEYADIDPMTYNSPLKEYQNTIDRLKQEGKTDKIKVLIIQHTFGNPNSDTDAIVKWAKKFNILTIEDCAHVFYHHVTKSLFGYLGDASFYSFQWNKPLTIGLGGMARINNQRYLPELHTIDKATKKISLIKSFFLLLQYLAYKLLFRSKSFYLLKTILNRLSRFGLLIGSSQTDELEGKKIKNYLVKMGFFQKIILRIEDNKIIKYIDHRKILMKYYDQLLQKHNKPLYPYEHGAVLLRYPLLINNRDECLKKAAEQKIELGDWFNFPLHPRDSNQKECHLNLKLCPQALKISQNIINLPLHKSITKKRAEEIINFILKYL